MSTLQITLPEDIRQRAIARATESGFPTVEAYIAAIVQADVEEELLEPDPELEALLEERLNDPRRIDMETFVKQLDEEISARRSAGATK